MDDLGPRPHESLDRLVGDWRILQLQRGHRFSTDDLVTAWRASLARPGARRLLDLGCGIGSVGLATLHLLGHPDATLIGVEAQAISADLARRTVRINGLGDRVRIVHGDLRDTDLRESFELITGSPPYLPRGTGIESPIPQRAAARIELRGSVFDYCAAARRHLAPGGAFCFVMAAPDPRAEAAPAAHGLAVLERWDYTFRADQPPRIATFVCAREEDGPHPPRATGHLMIRGPSGDWTPEYLAFRGAVS